MDAGFSPVMLKFAHEHALPARFGRFRSKRNSFYHEEHEVHEDQKTFSSWSSWWIWKAFRSNQSNRSDQGSTEPHPAVNRM